MLDRIDRSVQSDEVGWQVMIRDEEDVLRPHDISVHGLTHPKKEDVILTARGPGTMRPQGVGVPEQQQPWFGKIIAPPGFHLFREKEDAVTYYQAIWLSPDNPISPKNTEGWCKSYRGRVVIKKVYGSNIHTTGYYRNMPIMLASNIYVPSLKSLAGKVRKVKQVAATA